MRRSRENRPRCCQGLFLCVLEGYTRVQPKKVATADSEWRRVKKLSYRKAGELWSSFIREWLPVSKPPRHRAAGMGSEPGKISRMASRFQKPLVDSIRLQSAYFGAFGAFSCFPLLFDEFHRMTLEALILRLSSDFRVEPTVGIEPTTGGLQNRCSTAELCWPIFSGERD